MALEVCGAHGQCSDHLWSDDAHSRSQTDRPIFHLSRFRLSGRIGWMKKWKLKKKQWLKKKRKKSLVSDTALRVKRSCQGQGWLTPVCNRCAPLIRLISICKLYSPIQTIQGSWKNNPTMLCSIITWVNRVNDFIQKVISMVLRATRLN